jgi:hypothetical protein
MRPRGWRWEWSTRRVLADDAYEPLPGVTEAEGEALHDAIRGNVTPIRATEPLEASRWPVAGCISGIGVTAFALVGFWYLIWRMVVRVVESIR